jgi:hypothetical protein
MHLPEKSMLLTNTFSDVEFERGGISVPQAKAKKTHTDTNMRFKLTPEFHFPTWLSQQMIKLLEEGVIVPHLKTFSIPGAKPGV